MSNSRYSNFLGIFLDQRVKSCGKPVWEEKAGSLDTLSNRLLISATFLRYAPCGCCSLLRTRLAIHHMTMFVTNTRDGKWDVHWYIKHSTCMLNLAFRHTIHWYLKKWLSSLRRSATIISQINHMTVLVRNTNDGKQDFQWSITHNTCMLNLAFRHTIHECKNTF